MTNVKFKEAPPVFDRMEEGYVVDRTIKTPRPKDAATLILIRRDGPKPRVLVGKRSRGHDFMPDKYVFPGGRVDTEDGRAPSSTELHPDVETALAIKTRRKPRAFGLTAVRETFEETGLIIGKAHQEDRINAPGNWSPFVNEGVLPCLQHLSFIGRAITPPYQPKRFDARFFMAEAEDVLMDERPAASGAELIDVRWIELEEAENMDLPSVTQHMLHEVHCRIERPDTHLRPVFLRYAPKGQLIERI